MNNQVLAPGCRRVSTYKTLDNLDSGQNNKLKEVMEDTSSLDSSRANRIYDVKVTEAGHCFVLHTLTSAFCPAADKIPKDIQMAIESIPGIKKCHTRITMTPPWTQESIDPTVRSLLFGY